MLEVLSSGDLEANTGDGKNHVFKIICGVGKHSQRNAVLVRCIPPLLDKFGFEYYLMKETGVFLVHLNLDQAEYLSGEHDEYNCSENSDAE